MTAVAASPVRLPVLADVVPGARVRDVVLVTGAALLTAVLAQVAIPVAGSPVPITGQTLAVVVTAAALGPARGVAAQALYLVLGAVGLPFYSDASGGVEVVAGATGGYLLGFVPAALLIGLAARQGHDRRLARAVPLFLGGQLVIFAVGVPWLAAVADLPLAQALEAGFYPFILGGVVKAAIAGLLLPASWSLVARGDRTPRQRSDLGRRSAARPPSRTADVGPASATAVGVGGRALRSGKRTRRGSAGIR